MQIKKQLAFLMFGLLTSFGVESATAPLLITHLSGQRTGNVPARTFLRVEYKVTNLDSEPHRAFFNNAQYLPFASVTSSFGDGSCDVPLPAHGSCTLALDMTVNATIIGGPFVCIGSTDSVCSGPVPGQSINLRVSGR